MNWLKRFFYHGQKANFPAGKRDIIQIHIIEVIPTNTIEIQEK